MDTTNRSLPVGDAALADQFTDEQKRRWTAVDEYGEQHLRQNEDSALTNALDAALSLGHAHELPCAEVSPLQGKFLAAQCQLIGPKQVLEVGTLGAYSTIWMASSDPDVQVTTVELDPTHAEVARRAVVHAGLHDRIDIKVGAALDILPGLRGEVESGRRRPFDLVFIDADKDNNRGYFAEAIEMCRSRACIIVDNVVRDGAVVDPEAAVRDGRVRGTREVIEAMGGDRRVLSATMVQTVGHKGYDGFLLAVVK